MGSLHTVLPSEFCFSGFDGSHQIYGKPYPAEYLWSAKTPSLVHREKNRILNMLNLIQRIFSFVKSDLHWTTALFKVLAELGETHLYL